MIVVELKYGIKIIFNKKWFMIYNSYDIIYADPAWIYKDKAKSWDRWAECKYKCSSVEEMWKILINNNIKINKDSVCLMWCTYPQIKEWLKLMELWWFTFKTIAFTWVKTNKKSDSFFMWMGRYTRWNPEIILLWTKWKSIPRINAWIRNLQIHKIREHSRKPDEIREEIVKLFWNIPRIELFARTKTEWWDVLWNEIDKF